MQIINATSYECPLGQTFWCKPGLNQCAKECPWIRENQTCTKSWLPFVSPSAPLFPKGNRPFSGTGVGSPSISTGSPVWIHCFPPPGNWGQKKWREMVGLNLVHVWFSLTAVNWWHAIQDLTMRCLGRQIASERFNFWRLVAQPKWHANPDQDIPPIRTPRQRVSDPIIRTVSEYCSARVSHVGLSTN